MADDVRNIQQLQQFNSELQQQLKDVLEDQVTAEENMPSNTRKLQVRSSWLCTTVSQVQMTSLQMLCAISHVCLSEIAVTSGAAVQGEFCWVILTYSTVFCMPPSGSAGCQRQGAKKGRAASTGVAATNCEQQPSTCA